MSPSSRPLSGKIAVITGASSGIGAATARTLAALGASLRLGARRLERVEALASELGGGASAHALDVTVPESCRAFTEWATGDAAGVDILVNNAGLARGLAPVVDSDERDWREMLESNLMGLMRVTRLFLPSFIARDAGDIVHVGSVAGLQPYAKGAAYCASKAAVESFAQALRLELFGTRIRQLVIEPGLVETEFSVVRFHGDAERAGAVYSGVDPLTAADVADCIGFAVTRPPHVSLHNMLVMATAQATATLVHRKSGL
ncbi:MAG: SDR family NAD(P)-dependent oxidoreductase [Sorangiineae bacterium]|nr:SDR family NAD(P)-dependent oxidoreductase [Polyangiaceae bacterium]MEB2321045.1 SDR family NAD(P)-dependent oxidoreductase [Sorangiineae bacterium]